MPQKHKHFLQLLKLKKYLIFHQCSHFWNMFMVATFFYSYFRHRSEFTPTPRHHTMKTQWRWKA